MTITWKGKKYELPRGYRGKNENGFYMDGHGVEYTIVQYGYDDDCDVCLETVYSKHVRTVILNEVK